MSQTEKIKMMLESGSWICSADILSQMFIVDYRKRISEIKQSGIDIESEPCRGRCGRNHTAGMHVYRIVPKQEKLFEVRREVIW